MEKNNKKVGVVIIVSIILLIIFAFLGYIILKEVSNNKLEDKIEENEKVEEKDNNVTELDGLEYYNYELSLSDENTQYDCVEEGTLCSILEQGYGYQNYIYKINIDGRYDVLIKYINSEKKLVVNYGTAKPYEVESNYGTLTKIQKYNDYLLLLIRGINDDTEEHIIETNLGQEEVKEGYCFPDDIGKCIVYKYEDKQGKTQFSGNDSETLIEKKFSVDYNEEKFELISQEEINCAEFDYDLYESSHCIDDEDCVRRLQFCLPQG